VRGERCGQVIAHDRVWLEDQDPHARARPRGLLNSDLSCRCLHKRPWFPINMCYGGRVRPFKMPFSG
jgi:hypothetical protein